jgi:enoyl-CoA hydratase
VNALDAAAYREIHDVFTEVSDTLDIGVVLLLGDGACFSAGQDVSEASEIRKDSEAYLRAAAEALVSVTISPAIVVAGVQRFAIGAGLILATSADLLVIDEAAKLSLPELKYGVAAGAAHVSRWIGATAGERAFLTGEPIDPSTMARAGAKIVAGVQVARTARAITEQQASYGASTARMAKSIAARDRLTLAERYRSEIRTTIAARLVDFRPSAR